MRRSTLALTAGLLLAMVVAGCSASQSSSTREDGDSETSAHDSVAVELPVAVSIDDAKTYKGLNGSAQQGGEVRWSELAEVDLGLVRAFTGEPQANWIYIDESFAVSTVNNRGCAPAARSIEVLAANSIVVNLGQDECTFELYEGPYTSELDLPAEVTGRPITVAFRFLNETVYPPVDTSVGAQVLEHDVLD